MKYFVLVSIAAICCFLGYLFSKKYKRRACFYQALISLCQKFDVEINYSRERVKNIFLSLDEKIQKNLYGIDKNFILYLDKKCDLDKENLFQNINFLKDIDKDIIYQFFRSIGRSDLDSQSKEIKNYLAKFESNSLSAHEDNKKFGSLSMKLGIIVGLFIIVIFI
jgi:stage III sporulation protein AB